MQVRLFTLLLLLLFLNTPLTQFVATSDAGKGLVPRDGLISEGLSSVSSNTESRQGLPQQEEGSHH